MAKLDPKLITQLNNVAKLLSATGEEFTNKAKEIITLLIANQKGWIETANRVEEILEGIAEGDFEPENIRKAVKELAKTEDAYQNILEIRQKLDEIDSDRLLKIAQERDLNKFVNELLMQRSSLYEDMSAAFDFISKKLEDEKDIIESITDSIESQVDFLQQQVESRYKIQKILQKSIVDEGKVSDAINAINDVVANAANQEFTIRGKGTFDGSEIENELSQIISNVSTDISGEVAYMQQQLEALAAKKYNVEVDVNTGRLVDLSSGEFITGLAASGMQQKIKKTAALYDDVLKKMVEGKKVSKAQLDLMTVQERVLVKLMAEKRKELQEWTATLTQGLDKVREALFLVRPGVLREISELHSGINKKIDEYNKKLIFSNTQIDSEAAALMRKKAILKEFENFKTLELIDFASVDEALRTVKDAIDNIEKHQFDFGELGVIDRNKMVSEVQKIAKDMSVMMDAEMQHFSSQLMSLAAEKLNVIIDVETGEIFDKETKKVLSGDALNIMKDRVSDLQGQFENIVDTLASGKELTAAQNANLDETTKLMLHILADKKKELKLWKDTFNAAQNNLKVLSKYADKLSSIHDFGERIAEGFSNLTGVLPSYLQKLLGVEDIGQRISETNTKAIQAFKDKILETGSAAQAVSSMIGTWGSGMRAAVGVAGTFAALIGAMVLVGGSMMEKVMEIRDEYGYTSRAALNLYKVNTDLFLSLRNQHLMLEDISALFKEMIGVRKRLLDATDKEIQNNILGLGNIAKLFTYSNETAVQLHEQFLRIGAANDEIARKYQMQLGFLADTYKFVGDLLPNDLLEAAEDLSIYFAGMPDAAVRTAINVRKMGVSLKQAASVAERMLSLESFMTDMFELAAMGGPDLSAAFEFGIRGDIEGMTEAVMDAIGSLNEFNNLSFLQRKKLAATLGMQVNELGEALLMRERLIAFSKEEQDIIKKNWAIFSDIDNLSDEMVRKRISEVDAANKFGVTLQKIKVIFVRALLPIAESFLSLLENGDPIIDVLIGGLHVVSKLIQGIAVLVGGMLKPLEWASRYILKPIISLFEDMFSKVDGVVTESNILGGSLGSLKDITQNFVGVLTSLWVGRKVFMGLFKGVQMLSGGFGTLLKSGNMFKTVIQGTWTVFDKFVLKGKLLTSVFGSGTKMVRGFFGSILSGATRGVKKMAGVGGIFEKIQNAAKTVISKVPKGGIFEKIFGSTPKPTFDDAVKRWRDAQGRFTKGPEVPTDTSVLDKMKGIRDKISDIIKSMRKIVSKGFSKIVDSVKKIFDGIIDVVNSAIKGARKVFNKVINIISDVVSGIGKILSKGADILSDILSKIANVTGTIIKKIGGAVGGTIEKIFKGIGKGLSSFSPKAMLGAASLTVLSGAIWTSADAFEKFNNVEWSSVAKGISAISGLVVVSKLLSRASASLIAASAGIGIFALAMNPFVDSLAKFIKIDWKTLGIAGTAIGGLATMGWMLSNVAPQLFIGAAAIGALGLAFLPLANGVSQLKNVGYDSLLQAGIVLGGLASAALLLAPATPVMLLGAAAIGALGLALIPLSEGMSRLTAVDSSVLISSATALTTFAGAAALIGTVAPTILVGAAAIGVLGAAMMPFFTNIQQMAAIDYEKVTTGIRSLANAIDEFSPKSLSEGLALLFNSNAFKPLIEIGAMADPLMTVSNAIGSISENVNSLAKALASIDLKKINALRKISDISSTIKVGVVANGKLATTDATSRPSPRETAQNVMIPPPRVEETAQDKSVVAIAEQARINEVEYQSKISAPTTYDKAPASSNAKLELLLKQLLHEIQKLEQRPIVIDFGDGVMKEVVRRIRGYNNMR